jgi:hypothetical protein
MLITAVLTLEIQFDDTKTDAESVASAVDTLIETAMSTPCILDEYGPVSIGPTSVVEEE